MWLKLKFLFWDLIVFCLKHWKITAVVIGFFVVAFFISYCRGASFQKKVDKIEANIQRTEGQIEILNEQKNSQVNAVNQATVNSAEAVNKLENVKQKDSSTQSNNFNDAKSRFCKEFPKDIICQ